MIFPNLCIFLLFVISIINPLISDDGDFVCRRLISRMQHALETRLLLDKWRYQYFLNDDVVVAVVIVIVVAVVVIVIKKESNIKVEFPNKISPLNPYFYNHFHNLFRLFDVLADFLFTTSETMCDYNL